MKSKASGSDSTRLVGFRRPFLVCAALLVLALAILFRGALLPGFVPFSNDGPMGGMVAEQNRMPGIFKGLWVDLNWIGYAAPSPAPAVSSLLRLALFFDPGIFSKIFPQFAQLFVGLSAFLCFRMFKFSPIACILAGVAATLNSDFFGTSCWGVATQPIGFGCAFLALGALADTASPRRWIYVILAGFGVGLAVTEAFDIGALFSITIAAFVVVQALTGQGPIVGRVIAGVCRLGLVSICAGFIAAATVGTLVSTQIKGVVGMGQDEATKQARWSEATAASIPRVEALGILVPGLFGFRFDTADGGAYWGLAGSDPAWDGYLASDRKGPPPGGPLRAGAGSNYAGALVIIGALWALVQSFRREKSFFTPQQRWLVWFFTGVCFVAMLMMFGRFAPFYRFFYELPYASTMRNPAKFLHVLEWSLIVVFAFGMHGIATLYIEKSLTSTRGLTAHFGAWWRGVTGFDRKWVFGSMAGVGVIVLAWLIYASSRGQVESYLVELQRLVSLQQGAPFDSGSAAEYAKKTVGFSIGQVAWAFVFFGASVGVIALIVSGYFAGTRAKVAGLLLCLLLAVDLGWNNRHWIVIWNWKAKYVAAGSNPLVDFLKRGANQHRVAELPRWLPRAFGLSERIQGAEGMFQSVYIGEWTQQIFQYYDIQSLSVIQMPRRPVEYEAFEQAFQFDFSTNSLHRVPRRWELSNTRYLLGTAPLVNVLNQAFDPMQQRFKPRMLFEVYQETAGGPILTRTNTTGPYALIEYEAVLPRAKLYNNWHISAYDAAKTKDFTDGIRRVLPAGYPIAFESLATNDVATLIELADKSFDPHQTVLLSEPPGFTASTNGNAGTVEFTSYGPRKLSLKSKSASPSILLLNDKYDPNWQVTVDGKTEKLLRCNYVMRGVQLPAGEHQIEFSYRPSIKFVYVSFAATIIGIGLLAYLGVGRLKQAKASAN